MISYLHLLLDLQRPLSEMVINGDQHRHMGSSSTIEVSLQRCAIQIHIRFTLVCMYVWQVTEVAMQPVSIVICTPTLAVLLTVMSHLRLLSSQLTAASPDRPGD